MSDADGTGSDSPVPGGWLSAEIVDAGDDLVDLFTQQDFFSRTIMIGSMAPNLLAEAKAPKQPGPLP
ncbi:MAG: hypothetical protein M0Z53_06065 [Thermaerobacter sp.]|nr:hypothetical protein [Thermaerobacter sp.]